MGTKIVRTTRWSETDQQGRLVEVAKTKTCGPVCKTVKAAVTVGLLLTAASALTQKK